MGADHTAGYSVTSNILNVGSHIDPLAKEGQIELSRNLQIAIAAIDSASLCVFTAFAILDYEPVSHALIDMINAQYGANWSVDDWFNLGRHDLRLKGLSMKQLDLLKRMTVYRTIAFSPPVGGM